MLPTFLMLMISCGPSAFGRPRQPMPPLPEMAPVLWQEHFDQAFPYDIDDPSTLTIEDFGELVESWSGYGLGRSGVLLPAYTLPGVDDQGRALINPGSGAVRLWISPSWSSSSIKKGTGPGDLGCLLEMSAADGRSVPVVCWSLVINPDGTRISLVADSDSGVVELLGAPIQWTAGQAHFVTLNFGTNATALYLDGQLAVQGAGTIALPASVARLTFGSASTGTEAVQAMIDELYSFRRPLTAADVAFYYTGNAAQAALGPITVEEDLVRAARVLAIRSQPSRTVQSDAMLLETLEESGASAYEDGTLWIEITGATSNEVSVAVHGTQVDMAYELLSKTNLADTIWVSEGQPFLGQDGQTTTTVTIGDRTNSLFLRARSWVDSDGSGMPDWWQLQWFEQTGVDPYGDDDQDGWSNLQEYQNGTNPKAPDLPPPPQGLTVQYSGSGSAVGITWQPSGGAVTGYTLFRSIPYLYQDDEIPLSSTDTSYADTLPSLPVTGYDDITYQIQAHYTNGSSPLSGPQKLGLPERQVYGWITCGEGGRSIVTFSGLGADVAAVRFILSDGSSYGTDSIHDIPISSVTNGVFVIPETWIPEGGTECYVQTLDGNGRFSVKAFLGMVRPTPWIDGRQHLADNLAFLLRNARYTEFDWMLYGSSVNNPPNYAFVALYSPVGFMSDFGAYWPFAENQLYRNFVFSPGDIRDDGYLSTGVYYSGYGPELAGGPTYNPRTTSNLTGTGSLLSPAVAQWTYNRPMATNDLLDAIGITETNNLYVMRTDASNWFGLRYASAKLAYPTTQGVQYDTVCAGGPGIPVRSGVFYGATEWPALHTDSYYFCKGNSMWGTGGIGPASAGFSPTNTTPLFITGVGEQDFQLAGWAKQTILNGDQSKPVFLAQYFYKAYRANPDGTRSGVQTGVLSEYGNFFATEPGPAILTTKADLTQTNDLQGECMVQVIKLQLDVNHDGAMDQSFAGPDNTSWERLFVFWINNDYDRLLKDDDDDVYYEDSATPAQGKNIPDCNYHDYSGARVIPTQRDLEDYARLWICGVTSNLLFALPPDSTVTLDWGDVGNPNPSNPTIDLFPAWEEGGGIGYLTNSSDALLQAASSICPYIGRLGPGQKIQLNGTQFSNAWAGDHFIWCGVSNGTGGLTLTIADGNGNTLAQSTACIQLVDIKQMYERWSIGDKPSVAPLTNALLAQNDITLPFQYEPPADTNTPYILFVHGWNVNTYDKDRFAETAFKRLYWQGYEGRFGVFRWPTDCGFKGTLWKVATDSHNYDNSEYTAWKSATGLLNKLNKLNAQYPGHVYMLAHSMGNVVAGEALRLAGSNQIVRTYIATQGAIPAHVYDSTVTNLIDYTHSNPKSPLGAPGHPKTPNIYGDRLAGNSAAVGRRVNFFNFNDYALSPDAWCYDQELKPDTFVGGYYIYSGSTNDPPPWNNFQFVFFSGDPTTSLDIVNNLQQRYEALAYAANPYSKALGSTPGVGGFIQSIDLQTIWPPDESGHNYADHYWHSAEFRGDYWQQETYWGELLGSDGFNLK